jgi:predicted hotdog family 3-hydroxylacyl-ACP dehydratase
LNEYPPIEHLIPHSEPMVLLDRVLDWSPGRIECATQVRENARLVEDGLLLAPFTIEHMAQAVAVCLGYEAYRGGRGVRVGMIVSCRAFDAHMESARAGDDLVIRADRERGNESLSHFECNVQRGEEAFATATLTLFHGDTLVQNPS